MSESVKLISFYLPQFHPIAENNQWWGEGFTEWTNVAAATPLFKGHHQPHVPTDLGFYDLRVPEIREKQAALAREYGIHGFCYYHYWFNGRRLLEHPITEVLKTGKPNLPFCLCWANENWTKAWDGGEKEILMEQKYHLEDDIAHMKHLIPAFKDPRYIKIDGKPIFLVYRTELLPDPKQTAAIWRREAKKQGIQDLYLIRVESFKNDIRPQDIGFDGAVEFAPYWRDIAQAVRKNRVHQILNRLHLRPKMLRDNWVFEYKDMVDLMVNRKEGDYKLFRCVSPGFDNSPRRKKNALILVNADPEIYKAWLKKNIKECTQKFHANERLVFINAWNEWGEGNHLEPDLKWNRSFLKATLAAVKESDSN